MLFNAHSNLVGQHAFLSASSYHWVNYDDDKIDLKFNSYMAARKGTELHAFAHEAIRLGVKLSGRSRTIALYVNDAIGFRMKSEQILYYSDNCFGTPDTIAFRNKKLRIHDLKTGVTATSIKQLEVYAALFCLEYRYKPFDIEIELRIYQNDEVQIFEGDPDVVAHIMDKIITFDKRINQLRMEALE
jgi:hypothetical protein